jgi:hypothetical protein
MSKLIVFVYPGEVGNHVATDIVPIWVLKFEDSLMLIMDLT